MKRSMCEQPQNQYYILQDKEYGTVLTYLVEERNGSAAAYGDFFVMAYRKSRKGSWYRLLEGKPLKYWTFINRMLTELDESDAMAILLMAKPDK